MWLCESKLKFKCDRSHESNRKGLSLLGAGMLYGCLLLVWGIFRAVLCKANPKGYNQKTKKRVAVLTAAVTVGGGVGWGMGGGTINPNL